MGSPTSKNSTAARRAKMEEARRKERARDRRNRIITIVASVAVLAGLVGGGWYIVASAGGGDGGAETAAGPIKGVRSWSDLARNHVTTDVDYPMNPPAGGDHNPVWMDCDADVYDKAIPDENAVHSLEHGAVWITYNGKAADADVEKLAERVSATPYTLMSPKADQDSPVTLTAWGSQLDVKNASDARIEQFLDQYVQGDQTPEPGAPCTGGKTA